DVQGLRVLRGKRKHSLRTVRDLERSGQRDRTLHFREREIVTRWFRRARTTLLAICSVIPFGVWADNSGTLPSAVARGEYLARAANRMSCHTRPDGAPYAGGVAF